MSRWWLLVVTVGLACESKPTTKPEPPRQEVPVKMVRVAEGWFASGCAVLPAGVSRASAYECIAENPPRRLWVSAFEISELEVTAEAYANCEAAKACAQRRNTFPQLEPTMPALVSFEQASQYCRWKNMRLPTEAEWDKAARGTDGRMYPWGNDVPTCDTAALQSDAYDEQQRVTCARTSLATVGSHPRDRSPYGALDMAGNASEWTADLFVPDRGDWNNFRAPGLIRFADPTVVDPKGPTAEVQAAAAERMGSGPRRGYGHVMRGGLLSASIGTRSLVPMDFDDEDEPNAGFRCVRSVPSPPPPAASPVAEATVDISEGPGGFLVRSSAL